MMTAPRVAVSRYASSAWLPKKTKIRMPPRMRRSLFMALPFFLVIYTRTFIPVHIAHGVMKQSVAGNSILGWLWLLRSAVARVLIVAVAVPFLRHFALAAMWRGNTVSVRTDWEEDIPGLN